MTARTTPDPDERLHEAQLAALRTMAPVLAELHALALQILDLDAQCRAILRIVDNKERPPHA